MPRYIDAELLLRKSIQERRFFICTENLIKGGCDVQTVYNDLAEFVESIPTADVVEVVRCKDCVFFKESEKPHNYYCEWCGKHLDVYECDYCSRGIRRG